MDYKSTLNLPKTDFPMKADLPKREPEILQRWATEDLYGKIRQRYKGRKKFILHDGPPYANGDIHMGHALNKILKDMVVRYKTMRGHDSPYIPGWDCHGLPVEHQLFKELKLTKSDIDQVKFRKMAHDYAMKYVVIQRNDFKRLGVLGDWERSYLTLDNSYEARIIRAFGKLVEKGYIYKDLKPVNWCATCETALAEAEVEYEDKASPSIYVKFKLFHSRLTTHDSRLPVSLIIWTTTPWTLVANAAIALHPHLEYAFVEAKAAPFKGEIFVVAKDLAAKVMERVGVADFDILKTSRGELFEGLEAAHPFIERKSKVVLAEYVSVEEGTGCVHTAPGHGQEDYLTGKRYGLPTLMPVDSRGRFDGTAGEFSGMEMHKANDAIIERLKSLGSLVHAEKTTHSYPHCWRCKRPIIFRATEQYFMGVDHQGLRKAMLAAIDTDVTWIPEAGRSRIAAMIANRPDWCLSRQRYWGVPIIAFRCKGCGETLLDAGVINHVADIVEKEGSSAWFLKPQEDLLSKDVRCKKCKLAEFARENDIIDVWFDSGVSHQAVLKVDKELDYPCELYLEGSDQHRGWFQSALITAMAIDGKAPYKQVLTHGFVVDGEGKKMSKSLGNVISPHEVMKKYGADILRLWVASSDYSEDVRLSAEILTRLADAYKKIRNTFRYLLSNLSDFDPKKDALAHRDLLEIDRWILSRLSSLIKEAQTDYEAYAFHRVYRSVYNFCVYEVSSIYLDILKDRMYTFRTKSPERRSGQTAIFELLTMLLKVVAPLIAITADEAWAYLKGKVASASVHLEEWPREDIYSRWLDKKLDEKWRHLISVRELVLKKLEDKREAGEIGSGLEAKVVLTPRDAVHGKILTDEKDNLRYIFIVSQVELNDIPAHKEGASSDTVVAVHVEKAAGRKCQRCWNYSEGVGRDERHPNLCERCLTAV